jgi:hypothetical protein
VPPEVLEAAEGLAHELGTTTNDAIVRLALDGASARERRQRIETLASQRRAAVEEVGLSDALGLPSPDEVHEAMLAGRREP